MDAVDCRTDERGAVNRGYVLTVGEAMGVAVSDVPFALNESRLLNLGVGGAESNVAIGLARLGVPVVWVSRVGTDSIGDLVQREIAAQGVRLYVTVDPTAPTGFMVKERREGGDAKVTYYRARSAASFMTRADIPDEIIDGARLLHVSGVMLALSPSSVDLVESVMRRARSAGAVVSFDFNYRPALWGEDEAAAAYRRVLPLSDIVFAGEDEAALVVGSRDVEGLARALAEFGPASVIIKSGARGASSFVGQSFRFQPPFAVDVVDAVGAGDAFAAGYLSAVLAGSSPEACLEVGAATGALACTHAGDWEGAARADEVRAFLTDHANYSKTGWTP
jgi:2-dehydro-3-deoxygluconokinase